MYQGGCNFFYTLVRWPEGMQKSAWKLDQWARAWLRARAAPGRWSGALEIVLVERRGTIPGREGVFALQEDIICNIAEPKQKKQRGHYSVPAMAKFLK
jgi:hypothetical protein